MEGSTLKREKAVALRYSENGRAPILVAAGVGEIARQIIKLAENNGVPISRNDSLSDILAKLDIESEIPADTFPVVAEVLAFLYRADEAFAQRRS